MSSPEKEQFARIGNAAGFLFSALQQAKKSAHFHENGVGFGDFPSVARAAGIASLHDHLARMRVAVFVFR